MSIFNIFYKKDSIVLGYEFIKFSNLTAKNNPYMIVHEYERLIKKTSKERWELLQEIENKQKEEFEILLPIDFVAKHICFYMYRNYSFIANKALYSISLNDTALKKITTSEDDAISILQHNSLKGNVLSANISYKTIRKLNEGIQIQQKKLTKLNVEFNKTDILFKKQENELIKFQKTYNLMPQYGN